MLRIDKWINAMGDFETRTKFIQQGKKIVFIFHMIQKSGTRILLIQDNFNVYLLMMLSITGLMMKSKKKCGVNSTRRIIWQLIQQIKNMFVVHSILELHSISY
jgi:hypothetical protein